MIFKDIFNLKLSPQNKLYYFLIIYRKKLYTKNALFRKF